MTRVGPAGWAYKDWCGIVYPAKTRKDFHEPAYLAQYFDTIEINVSFYRPVPVVTAEKWVEWVSANPRFRFTAKLWRGFTHERSATAADEEEVKSGLDILRRADRLGALLLQFPWSFRNTVENREHVTQLCSRFREFPLVLEVRHASWSDPGVLDFLDALGLGLCNIDQPLFKRSLKPAAVTTSPVGYVRLHGRNYKNWFAESKYYGDRYDYLYTVEELAPWIDRIRAVEETAHDTYVVTNNHYLGKAVVNATEICSLLGGGPVPAPPQLVEHYRELAPFTVAGEQGQLPLLS